MNRFEKNASIRWIQTYTNKKFYVENIIRAAPSMHELICIEDIAHALSNQCRFSGHCERFYSVAEHSVYVSQHVPKKYQLWGLLHDASEAYLSDIPGPVKPLLPKYKEMEMDIELAISTKFRLNPFLCPKEVKKIDMALLATESVQIMKNPHVDNWFLPELPLDIQIVGISPVLAKIFFLKRFGELYYD